jgi:hypothetical protein
MARFASSNLRQFAKRYVGPARSIAVLPELQVHKRCHAHTLSLRCRATMIMSPYGDIRWDEKVDPRSRMALSYRNQRTLGAITADKEIDLEQA